MRIHTCSLLVLAAGATACAPYPHRIATTPEITGTMLTAGAPIANARVLIGRNPTEPCEHAIEVGATDAKGQFRVPPETELKWFYSFLNPPDHVLQTTNLCFQPMGESVVLGGQYLSKGNEQQRLEVICDVSAPKQRAPLGGLSQMCHRAITGVYKALTGGYADAYSTLTIGNERSGIYHVELKIIAPNPTHHTGKIEGDGVFRSGILELDVPNQVGQPACSLKIRIDGNVASVLSENRCADWHGAAADFQAQGARLVRD